MPQVFDCSVDTDLLAGMRAAKVAVGKGELVVIPTDTVYGIACDAFSPKAVQALLDAKGRGRQSPPPVLIANVQTLQALAIDIPQVAHSLAEKFWPGALTMIVRSQPSLTWDLGETKGTVALRVPNHKIALALLEETGPLAVSSANLTTMPAATNIEQAVGMLGEKPSAYLDAGESEGGQASTIIDLTGIVERSSIDGTLVASGSIRVVRSGAIGVDEIRSVVGENLEVIEA